MILTDIGIGRIFRWTLYIGPCIRLTKSAGKGTTSSYSRTAPKPCAAEFIPRTTNAKPTTATTAVEPRVRMATRPGTRTVQPATRVFESTARAKLQFSEHAELVNTDSFTAAVQQPQLDGSWWASCSAAGQCELTVQQCWRTTAIGGAVVPGPCSTTTGAGIFGGEFCNKGAASTISSSAGHGNTGARALKASLWCFVEQTLRERWASGANGGVSVHPGCRFVWIERGRHLPTVRISAECE